MKIYACHLLNDYSGSPKVLMQLIKGWIQEGKEVHLLTSKGREGFLSDIEGLNYHYFNYKWNANPVLRLFLLFWSQWQLFSLLKGLVRSEDTVYVNTVLPFGAALAAKRRGCRLFYHLHETSIRPLILKRFLFGMMNYCTKEIIYVSEFLAQKEPMQNVKSYVLYNAIEDSFLEAAAPFRLMEKKAEGKVLMICSLKGYKGVNEFIALANGFSRYRFRLVLNATKKEISQFMGCKAIPKNLQIYSAQSNVHPFYAWADVVLNLSRPNEWVETFGLTALEAMAYGLPIIVPPVGGIAELVEDGVNGYKVDVRNLKELESRLKYILEKDCLYQHLRQNAIQKIEDFRADKFLKASLLILNKRPTIKLSKQKLQMEMS